MSETKLRDRKYKLGRYIQLLRQKRGMTQEVFAEKTKLSLTYISYLEIGKYSPSFRTLCKIADTLGVKVKDLFPF